MNMCYDNVIIVDHDPGISNLAEIRGMTITKVINADLVVVKREQEYRATKLVIQTLTVEKDRYAPANRILTTKELITIMEASHYVTIVSPRGVLSEK